MALNQITDKKLIGNCIGEQDIPGLTDKTIPRRLGPKRASKIRKLFNLTRDDDVRQYVVRRPLPDKEGNYEYYSCNCNQLNLGCICFGS